MQIIPSSMGFCGDAAWHRHPPATRRGGGRGGRGREMSLAKQPFLLLGLKAAVGHSGPFQRRWPALGNVPPAPRWETLIFPINLVLFAVPAGRKRREVALNNCMLCPFLSVSHFVRQKSIRSLRAIHFANEF